MSEINKPENYDKLWEITLSNKDYSKVIHYANVTNFEYHSTGLEISYIHLNELCKPKRVWSVSCCYYNKNKVVPLDPKYGDILRFEDIYNIAIQEQSEVEETYHSETILINK